MLTWKNGRRAAYLVVAAGLVYGAFRLVVGWMEDAQYDEGGGYPGDD